MSFANANVSKSPSSKFSEFGRRGATLIFMVSALCACVPAPSTPDEEIGSSIDRILRENDDTGRYYLANDLAYKVNR